MDTESGRRTVPTQRPQGVDCVQQTPIEGDRVMTDFETRARGLFSSDTYMDVEDIPLARPSVPDPAAVAHDVERILKSGVLTNGPFVRELETRAAEYLDVRECVAVASCTAGLMLLLRASDLTGDVILPSFTFAATAHAVAWNG